MHRHRLDRAVTFRDRQSACGGDKLSSLQTCADEARPSVAMRPSDARCSAEKTHLLAVPTARFGAGITLHPYLGGVDMVSGTSMAKAYWLISQDRASDRLFGQRKAIVPNTTDAFALRISSQSSRITFRCE